MTQDLIGHSPVGFSRAKQYLACPASVNLTRHMIAPPEDDPDYRVEGTLLHAMTAHCFKNNCDAWLAAGEPEFFSITEEGMEAVQACLNYGRALVSDGSSLMIENLLHRPELHELAWGSIDFWAINRSYLEVCDWKFGFGVLVEPEENPQLMGYAYLVIGDTFVDDDQPVRVHVGQPRAAHPKGRFRAWETTAGAIRKWAYEVLKPGIQRAIEGTDVWYDTGEHCRFCPAKIVCPAQRQIVNHLSRQPVPDLQTLPDDRLDDLFHKGVAVRAMLKAIDAEMLRRKMTGTPGLRAKLVLSPADRAWKPGADEEARARLGDAAYTEPKLRSPAQMEKVSVEGKQFVAEWAFKPQGTYAVAREDDPREEVTFDTAGTTFGPALKQLGAVAPAEEPAEVPKRRGRPKKAA